MIDKPQQQEETDFYATHNDEHAGQGGSYEIIDGKRVLVHRTRGPEEPVETSGPAARAR